MRSDIFSLGIFILVARALGLFYYYPYYQPNAQTTLIPQESQEKIFTREELEVHSKAIRNGVFLIVMGALLIATGILVIRARFAYGGILLIIIGLISELIALTILARAEGRLS
jgi:hypothetical protein